MVDEAKKAEAGIAKGGRGDEGEGEEVKKAGECGAY